MIPALLFIYLLIGMFWIPAVCHAAKRTPKPPEKRYRSTAYPVSRQHKELITQ